MQVTACTNVAAALKAGADSVAGGVAEGWVGVDSGVAGQGDEPLCEISTDRPHQYQAGYLIYLILILVRFIF